jgi:transcription antitermination protein NusB
MTRRSRAREVALQLLVWRDLNPTASPDAVDRFVRDRLRDPTHEPFARRLYDGVLARQTEIDAALAAAAENWRLPRMPAVDRNVLRIGIFEMLDATDPSPPAVVINEAIELARRYGSGDSPAFVNGVLDQCKLRIADRGMPIQTAEAQAVPVNPAATDSEAAFANPQSEIPNPK